jgi:hypothetical protein
MVDKYERMKKDIEFERMEQEKRKVIEFGNEYMKSLKKVEAMVADKDEERWKKKKENSINIGSHLNVEDAKNQPRLVTS